tara:strand:+ start:58 stop:525 length:468 start_codon:yes stop_codon:yes gene_type:complete
MEFIIFLSKLDKEIIELVKKANYSIEENSPICLINKKYIGFHNRTEKLIVICTENAKKITNFRSNQLLNKNDNHKTGLYIKKALRHEATHMIQSCNNNKIIGNIEDIKKRLNKNKFKALKSSMEISGSNLNREFEAYIMEDRPRKVIKAIKKYCL